MVYITLSLPGDESFLGNRASERWQPILTEYPDWVDSILCALPLKQCLLTWQASLEPASCFCACAESTMTKFIISQLIQPDTMSFNALTIVKDGQSQQIANGLNATDWRPPPHRHTWTPPADSQTSTCQTPATQPSTPS